MGEEYVACVRGGQALTARPPLFSANSQHVYCCSGTTVRVYSARTGRFVRSLAGGHTGFVTGVTLNPRNCFQVITTGEDGNVVVWDTDGSVLKMASLGEPLADIALLSTQQRDHVFCLQKKSNIAGDYHVINFDLAFLTLSATSASDKKLSRSPKVKHLFDVSEPTQLKLVVNQASSSVIACSRRKIFIWNCEHQRLREIIPPAHITCLASHPTEPAFATGCTGGQIHIWYKYGVEGSQPESVLFHWHANAVIDVAFTHDGVYLMSGGEEAVLVIWQLSNNGATKNFLPRLGAPLKRITSSPTDELTAVCHADNVIRVLCGVSSTPLHAIGGLLKVCTGGRNSNRLPAGLVVHHARSALLLNGGAGMLQVYDPFSDKPFFDVDIVCGNYITPSLEKSVPFPVVNRVALSDDGLWLATVEFWERTGFFREQKLKFWRFSEKAGQFKLVSHVDQSLASTIVAIRFQPSRMQLERGFDADQSEDVADDLQVDSVPAFKPTSVLCATAYDDGSFKLWSSVSLDARPGDGTNVIWKCWSTTHQRHEAIAAAAFSSDGSVLAIAYPRLVILWDVQSGQLRSSLVVPVADEAIRLLEFGCQASSRYLLACTSQYLITWDLVAMGVASMVQVPVAVLTADRHSSYVAAISRITPSTPSVSVFVFQPGDGCATCHVPSVCAHPVVSAAFVPRPQLTVAQATSEDSIQRLAPWRRKSELFFVTDSQKLYCLRASDEEDVCFEQGEDEEKQASVLAKFIEKSEIVKTLSWPSVEGGQRLHRGHTLLSAPAHTLPSMKALCNSFLQSLLLPKSPE